MKDKLKKLATNISIQEFQKLFPNCIGGYKYLNATESEVYPCPLHKWISVEDSLPYKSGKYILFIRGSISIGSFVKELNLFYKQKLADIGYKLQNEGNILFKDWQKETKPYSLVSHWMPLPEAPEESER